MQINELVVGTEVPELVVEITSVKWFLQQDPVYAHKKVMVREYGLRDATGFIHLTTFNEEIQKKVGDFLVLRKAWCKADKFFGKSLTLGKYGSYE